MLTDLVRSFKPNFIFLIETFSDTVHMDAIKCSLGYHECFSVDSLGHSGGLSFLSKIEISV